MGTKLNKQEKKPNGMISLDQLLPSAGGSIFNLARIAMLRSTEIYDGSKPLVEHTLLDKSTTIAFREIAAGKVTVGENDHVMKEKESPKSQ